MRAGLGVVAAIVILAGCLGAAVPAAAHATLLRSVPADRAQLATPPDHLDLYFGQQLVQSRNGTFATVYDRNGKTVADEAHLDPGDGTHLVVPLRGSLDSGQYIVFWKSTSDEDGGVSLGSFSFVVGNSVTTAAQGLDVPAGGQVFVPDEERSRALSIPSRTSSGNGGALLALGGGLVVGLAAGITGTAYALRRRRVAAPQRAPIKRR